jgi:hypothetical protein
MFSNTNFSKKIPFITAIAALYSPITSATLSFNNVSPFIGIDLGQSRLELQQKFGEKMFRKNSTSYNLFAGLNFNQYFGMELGYQKDNTRRSNATLVAGDFIPGFDKPIPGGQFEGNPSVFDNVKLKQQNKYLGITGKYKIYQKFHLNAMLGLAYTKTSAEYTQRQSGIAIFTPTQLDGFLLKRTYKKYKIVPIARIGASYTINQNFSIRTNILWKKLSNIAINSDQNNKPRPLDGVIASSQKIKFKNMTTYFCGFVYNF